ncbi:MAG: D-alanine--D-alanine ligase [Bacteroidales bacterium]|nr:D-alanine--D-alanine ligase [Bacteroidales bacterium]
MKQRIAVLSGGYSGESGISVKSGGVVRKFLDRNRYEVFNVMVGRDKIWLINSDGSKDAIDLNDFSARVGGSEITFDCIFIAIHGTPGEDGRLQGYFDMLGLPYTGCSMVTSALTFNKHLCKQVVDGLGVKVAKSALIRKGDAGYQDKLAGLKMPLFIKPNNGGSSVGMSKISGHHELEKAMETAFLEDDEIIVEEFISGREITCGLLKYEEGILMLPLTEIVSKKDFFDYEAKYDPALADEIVPAQIPETVADECRKTSSMLFSALNCRGVVRFDYIFNDEGLFFLEVNAIPGLTEESIVPKMARCHGLTLERLFGILVEEALNRRPGIG